MTLRIDFYCQQKFNKSHSCSSQNESYFGKISAEDRIDFNNKMAEAGSNISESGTSCFLLVDDELITIASMKKHLFLLISYKVIKNYFIWNAVGGIDRFVHLYHTINLAYYPDQSSGSHFVTVVLIHGSAITISYL